MKQGSMQQLCSFIEDKQKIGENFIFLKTGDLESFSKFSLVGCRVLMLLVSGTMSVTMNGRNIAMKSYDYMDVFEGTKVEFNEISQDTEYYCIVTTRKFIADSLRDVILSPRHYMFKILKNPIISLTQLETETVCEHMRRIEQALYKVEHNYRAEMVKTCIRGLALDFGDIIIKKFDKEPPKHNLKKKDVIMVNFMDMVWKHFKDNREVSFYARELCVTPKHLSRVVKECSGMSPHDIIAGEVLSLAVQLLQNDNMLIQQVADVLHFSDQAAFSKFFKKYIGMSPVEYRKEYYG